MKVRITVYGDTLSYFMEIKLRVTGKDIVRAHTDHQWGLGDLLNRVSV
jgi:hypothetical protein